MERQLKASGSVREDNFTWASWVDRECTKRYFLTTEAGETNFISKTKKVISTRALYGVWNLADFVASTYGVSPPLMVGHDGQLELPCSEALWQAQTETEWHEVRLVESLDGTGKATTVKDACALIVDHNERESPPISATVAMNWSPFAVVCIMHIFSTRLWHTSHGTLSWLITAPRTVAAHTSNAESDTNARGGPVSSLLAVGRRCHDLIKAYGEQIEHDSTLRRTKDARWQLANAADVLRVCYGRTVPALARLDCDTLLRGGVDDVRVAIQEHVAVQLERNAEFTLAASVAFEGVCVPLRYGAQLYRKTGALNGSLENLITGWDNGESIIVLEHRYHADSQLVPKCYWYQNGPTWFVVSKRSA